MDFVFDMEANAEKIAEFKAYIKEKRSTRGSLMSVLHKGQTLFGYLPVEVQQIVSNMMQIPLSEIYGVVTFYSQFSIVPKGENQIGVCLGTACYVRGAQDVLNEVTKQIGIGVGETSADRKFSLQATRCVGACGLAPVMTIGEDVYGKLKASEVKGILDKYK